MRTLVLVALLTMACTTHTFIQAGGGVTICWRCCTAAGCTWTCNG